MAVNWDSLVHGPVMEAFGEAALYMPKAGGVPFAITGVFDEAYAEVQELGDQAVSSASPVLGVQLSQFPAPPKVKDKVTVLTSGTVYVVSVVEPDGHGWAKLFLNVGPG
jgi:hypothetical protein